MKIVSHPKPVPTSIKKEDRVGSKTAPLETDFNFDEENNDEYISTYNYFIYYNSIKPRDPRLKKPTYTPLPDMDFIKEGEKSSQNELDPPIVPKDEEINEKLLSTQKIPTLSPHTPPKPETPQLYSNKEERTDTNLLPGMYGMPNPINPQSYYQNLSNSLGQLPYDQNMANNYMAMYLHQYMQMLSLNDNGTQGVNNGFNPFAMNQLYNNPYMINLAAQLAKSPQFNNMNNNNMMNTMYYNNNNPLSNNAGKKGKKNGNNIKNGANHQGQNKNANYVNRNQTLLLETTTFEDLIKNLTELSKDPSGSRYIQKKFEECSSLEKEKIIAKLIPEIVSLSKDIFGNYVVQRIMECSSKENQTKMIEQLNNKVKDLTLHMYGCRVIQKALDLSSSQKAMEFLSELQPDLKRCIEDQNGNHVIQKIIEKLPKDKIDIILSVVYGNVYELSIHQYGCRVVQKIYDYSDNKAKTQILNEIFEKYNELCQDPFGNYVIQNILSKVEKGQCNPKFYLGLEGKVYQYSLHKFASNVVEKCLEIGNDEQNKKIIDEVVNADNENNEIIVNLVKDKYGNYVIQKMIEVADKADKQLIIKKIINSQAMKKRDGFSKHVMNFIEKLGLGINASNNFNLGNITLKK